MNGRTGGAPSRRKLDARLDWKKLGYDAFVAHVDGPGGSWRVEAHPFGEWHIRGPFPDDERSYQDGEVPEGTAANSRERMIETKKAAKQRLLETWATFSSKAAEGASEEESRRAAGPSAWQIEQQRKQREREADAASFAAKFKDCENCRGEGYVNIGSWNPKGDPCPACGTKGFVPR